MKIINLFLIKFFQLFFNQILVFNFIINKYCFCEKYKFADYLVIYFYHKKLDQ